MTIWPEGIIAVPIVFGRGLAGLGSDATCTLSVELMTEGTPYILWTQSRDIYIGMIESATASLGSPGLASLPGVDQAGWKDAAGNDFTGWHYRLTERYVFDKRELTTVREMQVFVEQEIVYLEEQPIDGDVGVPSTVTAAAVLSVDGKTGHVQLGDLIVSPGAVYDFTDLATWSITHALGRLPAVTIYDTDGTPVESDYASTDTAVVVTFPEPRTGKAVLT